MIIDNVVVEADEKVFGSAELERYVKYAKAHTSGVLKEIRVKLCADGKVEIEYKTVEEFERIRRITGYLTGDLKSWNDAKRAEESERVKHGVSEYAD